MPASFRSLCHDDVGSNSDGFARMVHALDLADKFGAGMIPEVADYLGKAAPRLFWWRQVALPMAVDWQRR